MFFQIFIQRKINFLLFSSQFKENFFLLLLLQANFSKQFNFLKSNFNKLLLKRANTFWNHCIYKYIQRTHVLKAKGGISNGPPCYGVSLFSPYDYY